VTIGKGLDWGTLSPPPADLVTISSDAELRELVIAARHSDSALPVVGLLGGDLMRTVGGTGDASRFVGGEPIPQLPIDIVEVIADEKRRSLFVAHLVARRTWRGGSWWLGPITAAMNAQFHGRWDVSPRGHPNDGKADIVTATTALGVQQRVIARNRLPLGTHVPHPAITVRQLAATTLEVGRPTAVWLDGVRWGTARRVELTVIPDALVVCV